VPTPLDSHLYYYMLLPLWWFWSIYHFLRYRPHVIVCTNVDAVPPSLFYTMSFRSKLVHDLTDFYYYHFDKMPTPVPALINFVTCAAIRYSKAIISISKEAVNDFISHHPACKGRTNVHIYPCMPTPSELKGLEKKNIKRYSDFTVCYFGNIAKNRYVKEMVEAMCELPECRFLLAGPEMEKGVLSGCLELMKGYRSVSYLGYLMRDELLERTARSHCILLPLNPENPHHRVPLPNKMYEGVFCHTPVITTDGTNSAMMVNHYKMGITIPSNSDMEIRSAVKTLSKDKEFWDACVEGCKRAETDIMSRYDYGSIIDAIEGAGEK